MNGYWVVWRATVSTVDVNALERLERGLALLRHSAYVVGADYDFDPIAGSLVFGVTVEHTATRAVAVHRASRAIRVSLQHAGIGVPHGLPYGPEPAMRLVLDYWPGSVKAIPNDSPTKAVRS